MVFFKFGKKIFLVKDEKDGGEGGMTNLIKVDLRKIILPKILKRKRVFFCLFFKFPR